MKNALRLCCVLCLLFVFSISHHFAQNLVPNHDFSEFSSCPANLGDILFARPWYTPNGKSTDFIHECSDNGYTSVPMNNWGEEFPAKGEGYTGIRVWLTPPLIDDIRNYREYLAVQMIDSLVGGEYYRVSFKVSIGDSAKFTTDDIGLAFDTARFPNRPLLSYEPALENEDGNIITTDEGWYRIAGQYQARGGEQHLAIGNFKDDANTTLVSRNVEEGTESCYFYIDEVIVEPCKSKFPETILWKNDTLLCPGNTLDLRAASIPNASYIWEGIPADSIYAISEAGTYKLMVEVDDCLKMDSIRITEAELPIFDLGADTAICEGSSLVLDIQNPRGQIVWNTQATEDNILISDGGVYFATATLGKCSYTDSIKIDLLTPYESQVDFDTTICEGIEIFLEASIEGISYLWQDLSTEKIFRTADAGEFWVDVQTVCFLEREYFTVQSKDCGCELFIPNVFTPNGDGINEQFQPVFKEGISNLRFNIYDRWGKEMFQTNDPSSFWNGNFQNRHAPAGVYYWRTQFECLSQGEKNLVMREGHLSLFR